MKLPQGFLASGIHCGIKKKHLDLGLICLEKLSYAIGFFTRNVNASYSVSVSKKHIRNPIKAILTNSGNANCFSHKDGFKDTQNICKELAKKLGVKENNILIASTGVIGKKLPYKKIISHIPMLINSLSDNVINFSKSIVTTDTFKKITQRRVEFKNKKINILGVAKGAGMIAPNLATMLAFIMTDANIDKKILKMLCKEIVDESFNAISIDGCTSTNDCIFILTSKKSPPLKGKKEINKFKSALREIFLDLAKMIVKDAEGATKFVTLSIQGAESVREAERAAFSIANSLLFKSALYGANSNWGRIIAALGAVGVKVKENNFSVKASLLDRREVNIIVNLKKGKYKKTIYMSDLSPRYIRINAGYN